MALAVESTLKLAIMLTLGFVALSQVFGGVEGLNEWIQSNESHVATLQQPVENGHWHSMLLLFFASVIVMPHMFHVTFTENRSHRSLSVASWAFPLFLLVLSVSIPILTWSGIKLDLYGRPEHFALTIGKALNQPWITMLSFIGSLSAASGLIIVTTLSLSSMVMNHLVMPIWRPQIKVEFDIYRAMVWLKRLIISALIMAAYGFYLLLDSQHSLYSLGIVAFVGVLQLLPGALSTLYWPGANRYGAILGLCAGSLIWLVFMLVPLMLNMAHIVETPAVFQNMLYDNWHKVVVLSIGVNAGLLVLVSLTTTMSAEESSAAEACHVQRAASNKSRTPKAASTHEFHEMLSIPLGHITAGTEVQKALADLNMRDDETRPHALGRLRERLEKNLSGLFGPTAAHDIVETFLPWDQQKEYVVKDIHFMESQLESYHSKLTGLAAELDSLRRYHRDTLDKLPMALFSVDGNQEIMLWNQAMSKMTGIDSEDVLGQKISNLSAPWNGLLIQFASLEDAQLQKHSIEVDGVQRYFSIYQAQVGMNDVSSADNKVMLLEDVTDNQVMESQLFHSERLASIGQLAAGVAHEIGNPITAIDCLAQELKVLSGDQDTRVVASQMLDQTNRVSRIVQTLVSYAHSGQNRQEASQADRVSLHECVAESISLLKLSRKHSQIRFVNACKPEHLVTGDQQKLQQVVINLLTNAVDASEVYGKVELLTEANAQTVILTVEDQGHGIPIAVQDRLFEPFFTTKEAGKGTGLGLALTWNIVEEHFGSIRIESPVNKDLQTGTRIIISLPRYEQEENRSRSVKEPGTSETAVGRPELRKEGEIV